MFERGGWQGETDGRWPGQHINPMAREPVDGVFKTKDGGRHWSRISDPYIKYVLTLANDVRISWIRLTSSALILDSSEEFMGKLRLG